MMIGHLTIAFDDKRPSATFVWPETGEAMKMTYVDTVDHVMHLVTPDQRRIVLPLVRPLKQRRGCR